MAGSGPIEPPEEKIISTDTLRTGQFWGLAIGDATTTIYSKIQNIQPTQNRNYLGIIGNIYTSFDAIKNKIPLYLSIILDENPGTGNGIQIHFSDNKVKHISTNGGTVLKEWPSSITSSTIISMNDPIESIYSKLDKIKAMPVYAKYFQRISFFEKDLKKPFDVDMSESNHWDFNFMLNQKSGIRLTLNFQDQKLISIYSTLFEVPKKD